MSPEQVTPLIGAIAGAVVSVLTAIGFLWVKVNRSRKELLVAMTKATEESNSHQQARAQQLEGLKAAVDTNGTAIKLYDALTLSKTEAVDLAKTIVKLTAEVASLRERVKSRSRSR